MVHNGPYTTGDHGFNYNSEYVKAFSGICSTYEVDLVLQAHDHTYSKTYPYLWGAEGYYENEEVAEEIVNFYSTKYEADGIIYDYQPNGTYYVSCGAAGHRIGENKKYAESVGEKSYINRGIKIAIDSLNVNSVYGTVGEKSSADLGLTMFGLLNIEKNKLIYSFYVVNEQGVAVLYDQLAIMK